MRLRSLDAFNARLASIHDKKIAVILRDQAAIQSLEAIQSLIATGTHYPTTTAVSTLS